MAQSKAHQLASERYNAKAYERLTIRVKKGQKEYYEKVAAARGVSLNKLVNDLLEEAARNTNI